MNHQNQLVLTQTYVETWKPDTQNHLSSAKAVGQVFQDTGFAKVLGAEIGERPVKHSICLQYFSVSFTGFLFFCSLTWWIQCRREAYTISIERLRQNKERCLEESTKAYWKIRTKALASIKTFHKYAMNRKYWAQIIYKQTKHPQKPSDGKLLPALLKLVESLPDISREI